MPRTEHVDAFCPICDGTGWCMECGGLGTREDYYRVQALHERAIKHPNGTAAMVLEQIEFLPEIRDRAYWVSRMIQGALRQEGLG